MDGRASKKNGAAFSVRFYAHIADCDKHAKIYNLELEVAIFICYAIEGLYSLKQTFKNLIFLI